MSHQPAKDDSSVLPVLERYRAALLEEAQSIQTQCAVALNEERATHARAEQALESSYTEQRTALTARGRSLSPETLSSAFHYRRAQSETLARVRDQRDRAQKRLTQAQESLTSRLEELRVIERLRDKRKDYVNKERRRRAQMRLDELGIVRNCQAEAQWPSQE